MDKNLTFSNKSPAFGYIETNSGIAFPLIGEDINFDLINIKDAAWSLSGIQHFNSHADFPFSVASHSMLVADVLAYHEPDDRMLFTAGLIHDLAEYIVGDVPAPVKYLPGMESLRNLENGIKTAVFKKFGVSLTLDQTIKLKAADCAVLAAERKYLFFNKVSPNMWHEQLVLELQGQGYFTYYSTACDYIDEYIKFESINGRSAVSMEFASFLNEALNNGR